MGYMDHDEPYSEDYIRDILSSVKTIAMVGASPDKTKFSYGVLRVLHETGYDIIPVNPRPGLEDIRGLKVYASLAEIDPPVDMVDVFRKPEDLPEIARQAAEIGASVLCRLHLFWSEDCPCPKCHFWPLVCNSTNAIKGYCST